MKKLLVIAALLSAPVLAQASTNLVANGSFEDYSSVSAGTWSIFGSGNGWTTDSQGIEIRNAVAGTAAAGDRFAELDTNANSWISQTISTSAFQSLALSFSYAPRAGVASNSDPIQVFWNDKSLGIVSANGTSTSGWMELSFDVKANEYGLGVLKFAATGVSDSFGGSLDNVSVTAVPEPGSSAMLLAGLGILGAISRRRNVRA
jgi:hypothetical protein